jgi:hypothetical protein
MGFGYLEACVMTMKGDTTWNPRRIDIDRSVLLSLIFRYPVIY